MDGLQWMLSCRVLKLPYAIIVQANGEYFWPQDGDIEDIVNAYRSAEACFFVSHRNLELFEAQIGERLMNAKVVRNAFNVPRDVVTPWPIVNGAWRAACIGRLQPTIKGQDILLKVLSAPKWRERPLHVTFYGAGPNRVPLERLARLYDLRDVEFAGHVRDIATVWSSNHALILPTRFEGLPLVLVEAMLCSRIGIVTDVAGNTEVVEDELTGFVARAPTAALFDEAMERAWARKEHWREMGAVAARRIREIIPKDPVEEFCGQLLNLALPARSTVS